MLADNERVSSATPDAHSESDPMQPTPIRLMLPLAIAASGVFACSCVPADRGEVVVRDSIQFIPGAVDTLLLDDGLPPVLDAGPPAPDASPPPVAATEPEERCDPNYTPCVPVDSDVDCASGGGNGPSYVTGPVQVIGSDVYGLDRDHDGVGCEG